MWASEMSRTYRYLYCTELFSFASYLHLHVQVIIWFVLVLSNAIMLCVSSKSLILDSQNKAEFLQGFSSSQLTSG
jgi:hypothetical protein